MTYTVNKTDGTVVAEISDFTKDNSTSLTLLGRGVVDYGESVAENFVQMMEHFASPVPPSKPIVGQLWYHTYDAGPPVTAVNKVKVWDGEKWFAVGGATSSSTQPEAPQKGDLWYDEITNKIYYYNGVTWLPVGAPYTGDNGDNTTVIVNNPPLNPQEGELWWMLPERQLFAYDKYLAKAGARIPIDSKRQDGSAVPPGWVLIGPMAPAQSSTYLSYTNITNSAGNTVDLLKVIVDGKLVGVWSGESTDFLNGVIDNMAFSTYNPSGGPGVSTLQPGLNINHGLGMTFTGTAINAELLDGLDSTVFVRKDQSDAPMTNDSVDLGNNDTRWRRMFATNFYGGASTTSADDVTTISFHGKAAASAAAESALKFTTPRDLTAQGDIAGSFAGFDGTKNITGNFTISESGWSNIQTKTTQVVNTILNGENGEGPKFLSREKSDTPASDNVFELGSSAARWKAIYASTFYGRAVEALYADLAERFVSDKKYSVGTIVKIGGTAEITEVDGEIDLDFFGVISENPAYVMNTQEDSEFSLPVVLSGRSPVRVVGKVKKGDKLVTSHIPGVAMATRSVDDRAVVGRALTDKETDEEGTVIAFLMARV